MWRSSCTQMLVPLNEPVAVKMRRRSWNTTYWGYLSQADTHLVFSSKIDPNLTNILKTYRNAKIPFDTEDLAA